MTAVTKPEAAKPGKSLALVQTLTARAEQITPFLPKGRTLDMVAHSVQMLTIKNPQLLSAVPSQLVLAITRGLRAGLDI
ncbi:hypothetical protein LRR18_17420, partial [Mangrovimonas sp. AS39]|uniref:hypothetical protein n=1 Tax=Mangrovimonas futianensis TaxID=2895523 RepID=UPI001E3CFBDB